MRRHSSVASSAKSRRSRKKSKKSKSKRRLFNTDSSVESYFSVADSVACRSDDSINANEDNDSVLDEDRCEECVDKIHERIKLKQE